MSVYNATIVAAALGTGDSTKSLVAAPATGGALLVKRIHWSVSTAAAQIVKVGKSGGTEPEQLLEFAASATGSGTREFGGDGFKLPKETALSAVPASAGPGIHFVVEYTIVPALT